LRSILYMRSQVGPQLFHCRSDLCRHKLWGVLIVISLSTNGYTQPVSVESAEYRNLNYGYGVHFPAEMQYETSNPPNSNHGFRESLAPATSVWVDGSYTDDTSLDAVMASERQLLGHSCNGLARKSTRLGLLPAVEITLRCAHSVAGDKPTIITAVVALCSRSHGGKVKYEICLQHPLASPGNRRAEKIFLELPSASQRSCR
jgi:hypothetical protein